MERTWRSAGLLKQFVRRRAEGEYPPDFDNQFMELYRFVRPFTMTSKERVYALRESVEYVLKNGIAGDIVECGVWKGGGMMAVARTLRAFGARRKLYLFDTFEGMSEPTVEDRSFRGDLAADLLRRADRAASAIWAYGPMEEVQANLRRTGDDGSELMFVSGKVEDTIPSQAPDQIALLRLDTDWYESTYHELVHLYPRLSVGGVLIVDDYGHWEGARKAVDRYIEEKGLKLLLHRIDYTGRACVKLEP